jgi:ABC-2 type transport system ATP-binding protein
MPKNEDTIVVEHLDKFYGKKQVLYDLNLTIESGMFGLLGRNGAGKTTLMKTLATLLQKKNGNVTVCGIPIEEAKAVRRVIGYLPQEFTMYPGMTVAEAMDYLGVLPEWKRNCGKKMSTPHSGAAAPAATIPMGRQLPSCLIQRVRTSASRVILR